MDRQTLLRRIANRASLSPNLRVRQLFALVRATYRLLGRLFPFLHLGWMANLRRAVWDGDDLVLNAWAFVRGADQGPRPEFEVWLHRRFSRERIHAEVSPIEDLDVLGAVPRADLDYRNMTFQARLTAETLAALPDGGTWQIRVGVTGGGRRTWGPLRRVYAFGSAAVMRLRPQGEGRLVGPRFHERRGVLIVTRPSGVLVREVTVTGREISLRVDAGAEVGPAVLTGVGQEDVPLAAMRDADGLRLVGALPPGNIVVDEEFGDRYPPAWTAHVGSGRNRKPLTLLDDALGHRPDATSGLVVRGDADRTLEVVDVPHFVELDDVERVDDDDNPHLRLTGTIVGDPDAFSLVMSAPRLDLPVTLDSIEDGRFTASVPLRIGVWGGPPLPPMRGAYSLEGRVDDEPFSTFVSPALIDRLAFVDSRPDLRIRLELARRDEFRIHLTRPQRETEHGSYNQSILFERFAHGRLPAIDAVFFESFFGRNATCNPRAIDREIARRRPDLTRYWSVDDYSIDVPEGSTPLVIGTEQWWRVRETARWIVTNEWLKTQFVKRGFQTVLQTWHGSMYKKIGLDRDLSRDQLEKARIERSNWDMFISQSSDTTPIIARAYDFDEGIVESGYPRNDELRDPDPSRVAAIRELLGVKEGTTVVMYAPTWREEGHDDVELLSVIELADRLGPGFTFLQRGHVRTLDLGAVVRHPQIIDVSTYPQINDLYLASDLLITDYSSMMFDYSVTRRPMIFFTPDIEEYTDPKVRGVYFDLEEVAPGPVVRTPQEVVDLLGSIDSWVPTFGERYDAWSARFNHADDGHAAERAVDALFAFDPKDRS